MDGMQPGQRRMQGEGLGVLVKGQEWEREQEDCKEHMWIKCNIGGLDAILGFVYLKTGSDAGEANAQHLACISGDVREIGANREVMIWGDMNAHLEDFDGHTDTTGRMLEEFCEALDLVLVNAQVKCDGKITWERNNSQSTIDYCLMSRKLYNRLGGMEIDEEGTKSLGSDHKRIKIRFGTVRPELLTQKREGRNNLNDKQLQGVSKQIESIVSKQPEKEWTYEDLVSIFKRELEKYRIKQGGRRLKHKPKNWWDKEVKAAISRRQEASREHRWAKKRGATTAEVTTKWKDFQERKREAAALIQTKIGRAGVRWMMEINQNDRDAAKRFWEHINAQG